QVQIFWALLQVDQSSDRMLLITFAFLSSIFPKFSWIFGRLAWKTCSRTPISGTKVELFYWLLISIYQNPFDKYQF
ncbi:MAG TPA: hypothetical protein PLU50_08315, partial [Pseudobdellovibrionaceae bacterium]|nr:hypothetical protein [Pseudobdellovibrionaceae bacterium]